MDKKINLADLELENERLRRQLAELDKLLNKEKPASRGISKLRGMQDVAANIGKKIHSAPPRQGDNDYLELYILQKERDRLDKETALLKKRRLQLETKISNVNKAIAEKEEKALRGMTISLNEPLTSQADEKPGEEKTLIKKRESPKRYEYKEEEWNKFTLEY